MITEYPGPGRRQSAQRGAVERLAEFAPHRVAVLVDAGVVETPWFGGLEAAVRAVFAQVDRIVVAGGGSDVSVRELSAELSGFGAVLGVGGGSLLDQAKLATLLPPGAEDWRRVTVPQRSGLVLLPPRLRRPLPLVAVPTTLGTGAEVSRVACLSQRGGKRLVMGAALSPEAAVIDPEATASLPIDLVAEGVLEALFRLVSPYLGDSVDREPQDRAVEAAASRMVRLGHQVADDRRAGRRVQADVRRRIAELSALSHAEWLHAGRPPYSVKGWLLANELSTTVGSRKMPAVAALLPALWAAIECGEPRWGSADRLDRLWALLRRVEPTGLPARASAGIGALLDRWQIDRRLPGTDDLIDAVCARALRAWGAGLPMLGGLRADDIRPVLSAAVNVSAPAA